MGVEDCKWFTLEKKNDHCILYEECEDQFDCETCATGEKKCANGYKGTTPAPTAKKPEEPTCNDGCVSGCWVCETNWDNYGNEAGWYSNYLGVFSEGDPTKWLIAKTCVPKLTSQHA